MPAPTINTSSSEKSEPVSFTPAVPFVEPTPPKLYVVLAFGGYVGTSHVLSLLRNLVPDTDVPSTADNDAVNSGIAAVPESTKSTYVLLAVVIDSTPPPTNTQAPASPTLRPGVALVL